MERTETKRKESRLLSGSMEPVDTIFFGVVLIAFFLLSRVNFLLFHTLIEIISVGIMWAIFILVWNTRRLIDDRSVLFLGIAFFFVGLIDILHILSYQGLGVFPGNDSNLPTQLWIVGRYLQSISLFATPFLWYRHVEPSRIFLLFTGITILLVASVFGGIFPDCFLEGSGLTVFKKGSEYGISLILAAAMLQFYRQRERYQSQILRFILLSIGASILSELFFTFYVSVYGVSNVVGHGLKILAMLFLYKALIGVAIKDPFNLIFRELKEREQALQVSEERFRKMFREHTAIMLLLESDTGAIIDANPAAAMFYGYSQKQLCHMTIQQINTLPDEEITLVRNQAIEEKKNYFTFPHCLANGEHREVEVHSSPIISQGKKILFSIIHDITERKKAEDTLLARERYLHTILQTTSDGFWVVDMDKAFIDVNEAYCNMSGYSRDEILGMNVSDLDTDKMPTETATRTQHITETGSELFEAHHRRKDGTVFPVEISTTWIAEQGGRFVCFLRDITDQKRDEEENKNLAVRLHQSQKMEAIGTLAGGIAHDFNNMLSAIIGYAEMIRDDSPAGSSAEHDANQVLVAGSRAKDLVKQILAFSRQGKTDLIPLKPAAIIEEAVLLLRSTLPTTIEIVQDIDPNSGFILADPAQVHQILMNLCTNAFHAMEMEGGTLSISLHKKTLTVKDLSAVPHVQPGSFVQISIRDTGSGIAPEIREKIFDPYFTSKAVGKGTGMGLAVVHGIVQSYRGFISCDSLEGKGTVFHVVLPTADDHSLHGVKKNEELLGGEESILVVDDEEVLVELISSILKRLGYQVTSTTSSNDALAIFRKQPEMFDLIITDQTMPEMTGADLARSVLQIRPEMPMILCTGYSALISEEQAKSIGIKGFATKPLTNSEFADVVRKTLDL